MVDFIEYVVSELKNKRLSRADVLSLIKQYSLRPSSSAKARVIHPLLHSNISDLNQVSFSTTFTGQEFFLLDHQVKAQKVLPGVAYLEMVRAAVEQAIPASETPSNPELMDVVWLRPVVVSESREVLVALYAMEAVAAEQLSFEVYSYQGDEEILHCQGQVRLHPDAPSDTADIDKLQSQMQKGTYSSSTVYSAFMEMGLEYGPSHQAVTDIHRGDRELLASLRLPGIVAGTQQEYALHPSLMDGALQATIGLADELGAHSEPSMPFALESLRIRAACTDEMFAWVRYSKGCHPEDRVRKLDIDVYDSAGRCCVEVRGFSSRVMSSMPKNSAIEPSTESDMVSNGLLFAAPVWLPATAPDKAQLDYVEHRVVVCHLPEVKSQLLNELMPSVSYSVQQVDSRQTIAQRYQQCAAACFDQIKDMLGSKPTGRVLLQVAVSDNSNPLIFAGLVGLFKTAALENPNLVGQLILLDQRSDARDLVSRLSESMTLGQTAAIRFDGSNCQTLQWKAIEPSAEGSGVVFKDNGIYLITGGLGGLGVLFAKEILDKTTTARIILTGRAELTPAKKATLEALPAATDQIEYCTLDVSSSEAVRQLVERIEEKHGQLNGILHCAGMTADGFLVNKTGDEFASVLEPKVVGTFNIDLATKSSDLDFFALFSSAVSVLGNPGQADYAAANGFMDQFASIRNEQVKKGQRRGRTLSVNWPLWADGGMRLDPASLAALEKATGMQPLQTEAGMHAFSMGLRQLELSQMLVMEGDATRMTQLFEGKPERGVSRSITASDASSDAEQITPANADLLKEKTLEFLRREFSSVLKLPSHRINPQEPLETYGIDSILAMNLTSQLEKTFGPLSKTLFFEYQTITELTGFLLRSHEDQLAQLFSSPGAPKVGGANRKSEGDVPSFDSGSTSARPGRRVRRRPQLKRRLDPVPSPGSEEPIAIIGLSGRYPESTDVHEYWKNLRDGKDCIVEVPESRWSWRDFFEEERLGRHSSKWGGFIAGVDEFDPLFFGISPREATYMDPQERLFLQNAWMAVEDAGYTRSTLQGDGKAGMTGRVGVYVGVMYGEYNLSGSLATIANRVSYVLNLHGPSMTVDTMCSSSLTAIHIACQDLKQGRTSLAIAGGVNVSIHPNKYSMLSAGQFISSDGHCQSFGEGGDGYIPGEGVGAVVLKRLSEAEQRGHHIYGIIRGSALNHGGKTNGYTVPNPQAQSSAISQALDESAINARHISYIEAHGTGTKLGDPIEITALNSAFRHHTEENAFCLIGSAKSNVGHCESAAGVAGLTKVLMQMKHREIVPSLHSSVLNPHIDFDRSPFVVNQILRPWDRPVIDGQEISRIAGISSFGAGGSNAHLIVEEYQVPVGADVDFEVAGNDDIAIIPLSARTPDQLKQKALDLLTFIRAQGSQQDLDSNGMALESKVDLHSMAYTLQIGREAMDERLGIIAGSVAQLTERLQAFVDASENVDGLFEGQVKENRETISLFSTDSDFQETVDKWIANRKIPKLIDLWAKGFDFDWLKLYGERKPRLMSLPAYPFARDRFWMDTTMADGRTRVSPSEVVLHPLLHSNTSDLRRIAYSSTFDGSEPFLADGVVGFNAPGKRVLPPVAFLEMMRVAVVQASPDESTTNLVLCDIAWGQPLMADFRTEVELLPAGDGRVNCQIFSLSDQQVQVHCQGCVVSSGNPAPKQIDVRRLQSRMQGERLENDSLYEALATWGYRYDAAHRAIESTCHGDGELLAKIEFVIDANETPLASALHPAVLESVLQASIILTSSQPDADTRRAPMIPVTLQSVRPLSACPEDLFLWVRWSKGAPSGGDIASIDVDICDQQGNVCIEVRGLALAELATHSVRDGVKLAEPAPQQAGADTITAKPQAVKLADLGGEFVLDTADSKIAKPQATPLIRPSVLLSEFGMPVVAASMSRPGAGPITVRNDGYTESNEASGGVSRPLSKAKLEQELAVSLAEALYMDVSDIDHEKSFVDLGLDSIVGVEWVKAINSQFRVELSATRVYDYSNIKELAAYLLKMLGETTGPEQKVTAELATELEPQSRLIASSQQPSVLNGGLVQLEQELTDSLAEALYMDSSEIDSRKAFVDLGLDSIVGVEWIKAINTQYGLEISATRVYDYSNIKELAVFLEKELKDVSHASPKRAQVSPKKLDTALSEALDPRLIGSSPGMYPVLEKWPAFRLSGQVNPAHETRTESEPDQKIAIVGMSGRYPQAKDLQEYWSNLVQGRNSIVEVPSSRWDVNRYFDPDPARNDKVYCKWLGALDDVDCFDPMFFQISPAEAEVMDPQHRLFMQESFKAFEDAGYTSEKLSNSRCGVYLGIMSSEYSFMLSRRADSSVNTTGNSFAIGAARIAYHLNLKGPAIPVDTACSSSLVAIHLACQALQNHEIDMALTGGVTLYLIPEAYLGMCQAGMLSPEGQCKAFDNSADGFVPGEGVGALVLKRLADAEADNDVIHGVILGTAINQDGKTNGITAPSVNSQIELGRVFDDNYFGRLTTTILSGCH